MRVFYVFDEIKGQDCSRVRKKLGLPRNTRDNDELIHHSNNDFQNERTRDRRAKSDGNRASWGRVRTETKFASISRWNHLISGVGAKVGGQSRESGRLWVGVDALLLES